ncbi:unnamed protein product [Cunninghamella blakesleeana]
MIITFSFSLFFSFFILLSLSFLFLFILFIYINIFIYIMGKLLLVIASLTSIALAVQPPPRLKGGCVLVSSSVYCYGGVSSTSNPTYLNDHYVLNLNQNYNDLNSLSNGWQALTAAPEGNSEFVIVPSSSKSYFVNGGTGSADGKPLLYQSLSFDTTLNKWYQLPFKNATDSLGQARGSFGVINSKNSQVYIWGGYWDSSIGSSNSSYSNSFLVMNPTTGTWNPTIPSLYGTSTWTSRIGHALINDGYTISVIGGQEAKGILNGVIQWTATSMNSIPQYSTTLGTWTNKATTGTAPSPRSYLTATSADNYNYKYIIYGGMDPTTNKPVTDTMYTLETYSGEWKSVTSNGGPGPRWGHSAISYNGTAILFFNGVDSTGSVKNDVNVLSTTGFQYQWQTSFSTTGSYSSKNNNDNNNNGGSSKGGSSYSNYAGSSASSKAVVGGISAGSVVFISLFGAALFLFVKKNETHQPVSTAVLNQGTPLNTFTGYEKIDTNDQSQFASGMPMPPPASMATNVTQGGEAASYLQNHPTNNYQQQYQQPYR